MADNIMQSQKAVFSLRGTNINLPTRYKIRKFRPSKTKSQKMENGDEHLQEQLPFIIETKEAFPIQLKLQLPKQELTLKNIISVTKETTNRSDKQSSNTVELVNSQPLSIASQARMKYRQAPNIFKRNREHYSSMKTKRCACGNCQECMKDFTYFLRLFSEDQSVPDISAKSWCIWKKKNGRFTYYYGKRIHKVRQIASLSKMVTAMVALDYLYKLNLQPHRIKFSIRKTSTLIGGTTAHLEQGEVKTLLDLFYCMLLPSGNDAAIAVSEAIGLLMFLRSKNRQVNIYSENWYQKYLSKNYSYMFIGMMNEKCQKIGTLDTKFYNSHGNDAYDQLKNISTCNQLAKISSQFMNYPLLKEIASTKTYGTLQNTNKLLEDGFEGIKTGITETAGPCLAASYKDYIIIVLNSKSMNQRWFEVKKLVKWMIKKS